MSRSLKWIRQHYNVPAFTGTEITYQGKPAVILGGRGQYLRMRVEGEKRPVVSHPCYAVVYPVLPLPERPRGWCAHCMEERALRLDGTVVRHLRNGYQRFPAEQQLCPGAGFLPWAVCSWTVPAPVEESA